jgi:uncharacterized membrane protein
LRWLPSAPDVERGNAALFVLFRSATADKVIPLMAEHGGKTMQTSLEDDAETAARGIRGARGRACLTGSTAGAIQAPAAVAVRSRAPP